MLFGVAQIVACVAAGGTMIALAVGDGSSGFGALVGGLVAFVGLLNGITTCGARTYLAGRALNVTGAATLRRLMIAMCCCASVLAALTVIPLVAGADLRNAWIAAVAAGIVAGLAVIGTVAVAPLLKPMPIR